MSEAIRIDGCPDLSALADSLTRVPAGAPGQTALNPETRPGRDTITLAFAAGYSPSATKSFFQCGANMRANRWVKAAITKQIRADVVLLARSQQLPRITGLVDVLAVQHPAVGRRAHDSENIAPLVKAAIDGLRDAGVLLNDSPKYVRTVSLTTGERVRGGQLVLHVTPVPRTES